VSAEPSGPRSVQSWMWTSYGATIRPRQRHHGGLIGNGSFQVGQFNKPLRSTGR